MSVLVVTRRGGEFLKIPFHSFCMSRITFPLSTACSFRNTADENIACVRERQREGARDQRKEPDSAHLIEMEECYCQYKSINVIVAEPQERSGLYWCVYVSESPPSDVRGNHKTSH